MTTSKQEQQLNSDEEKILQVSLDVTDQNSGQYTLSFGSSQYLVTLKPEASVTFSDWLRRLHPVLTGQNDPAADIDPQDLLRKVGTWLWKALLPESAPPQECEALAHALRIGRTSLLLALPETLSGLPWELLYDPQFSDERGFLAHRRPLMRLSASATVVPPLELPLRVLLLISSPPNLEEVSRVDVESERAAVEQAIHQMRESGFLHLVVEDIVTPKRVERLLNRFKPHIVHYIGHGQYDQTNGAMLLWEDDQGNALHLSTSRIASLLRSRNLHAVVLHACETARSNARAEVLGLAGTLAQDGLPAILAQQANLTYESSQLASHAWYKALVAGQSMASALLAARQALIKAGRPDWAVPILQGSIASLTPVLAPTSLPGIADPQLTRVGAAADLPTPADVFVGRHSELRALHLMLEDMSDSAPVLALITGPGGMGKSTLVAQAVTRYGGAYQAALMLRCQGYQSIDLFLQSIGAFLKRLGAPLFLEHTLPDPKRSTEAKIDEAVVALNVVGPVLLVIDNLESVQNEGQLISDKYLLSLLQALLSNLHSGRVLITGRYMAKELLLQKEFETKFLHLSLDDLSPYETSQLLLRYPPLARLSEVVRQILLREFGGLPYVYHLLSSKAAIEDLEQIIYEVRDYGAVKQRMITEEHKQHTAKEWQKVHAEVVEFATLEVIISRLSRASRTLLAQLGVLHRPFPLAAIEQGLGMTHAEWQPLLDWSLLHYDLQEKSYHLHSLTRRYAEGLLEEQPRKQAQLQLAVWYEHYADQDSHSLVDYLEAHRLLRAAGRVRQAGQLVMHIADKLILFGLYPLLLDLCAKTLSDVQESDEWLMASALYRLGDIAFLQGNYEKAQKLSQQSLEITEHLDEQRGQATSLYLLGKIAFLQGNYEKAQKLSQQSLEIAERLDEQRGQATLLHQLGQIAQAQGKYEEARGLYQQSLDLFEQLGDQSGRAISLGQLGTIAQHQGKYEEAHGLYQQCLDIFEQMGYQSGRASSLGQLGNLAYLQGKYEEAHGLYQQCLEIAERLGSQHERATTLHQLGQTAQAQGEYEEARGLYQQSLDISKRIGNQSGRATTLHQLGVIAQAQGKYEEARGLYQQSLDLFERLGDQSGRASSLGQLGNLAYLQGKYEEAHGLYQQCLDISKRIGNQSRQAGSLGQLGKIAQHQGKYEEARGLYQQSLDLFEQLGDQSGRASSLGQLGLLAYEQGNFEQALIYTIQAYILLDALRSPFRAQAWRTIAKMRGHMVEETFMAYWQALASDRPPPALPTENAQKLLLQVAIDFINVATLDAKRSFLELYPPRIAQRDSGSC